MGRVRLLRQSLRYFWAERDVPAATGPYEAVRPLRQTIESINQTCKGRPDLERHGGRSSAGVIIRVLSRILALTAAIWHNDKTNQPIPDRL
ncbi:hypothetical protein GCM10010412_067670 [Nonomuraea recticatena]|uniref:Transposase n=1 Tax=Nonomuraea recticatena TaxID=46178 RepID=A0ABN3SQ28_9ACTN